MGESVVTETAEEEEGGAREGLEDVVWQLGSVTENQIISYYM